MHNFFSTLENGDFWKCCKPPFSLKNPGLHFCVNRPKQRLLKQWRCCPHSRCVSLMTDNIMLIVVSNQIKSNHFYCHITTAQVPWWVKFLWACSRQCKKTTIYIWTVHIYRLYRRQCAKYTYIYSVHIVYYKDTLNYQRHIIHRMGTSTLCTLSIHNVVYT